MADRRSWLALAAALVSIHAAGGDYEATVNALVRGLPTDVAEFIVRRVGCNHWAGEEPFDGERARDIQQAMDNLKCQTLEQDEIALRQRHAADARVLKALDDAQNLAF